MRTILLLFIAGLCGTLLAADYGPTHILTVTSNLVSASTASTTNTVEATVCVYHTFHIADTTTGATNLSTITLDRTLDGSNWFPFATNTPTGTGVSEQTCTGTWQQFRARLVVTNALSTISVTYQGLR